MTEAEREVAWREMWRNIGWALRGAGYMLAWCLVVFGVCYGLTHN